MSKKRLIILVGPGASGKDFFAAYLRNKGYKKAKDYTTRPPRKNMEDDYTFVKSIPNSDIYYLFEVANKRKWVYGYSISEMINADFVILPPDAILSAKQLLMANTNRRTIIVYFNIPESKRLERLLRRGDNDYKRRLESDRFDFKNFSNKVKPHITVENELFKPDVLMKLINELQNT